MFHQAVHVGPFSIKYGWIAVAYAVFCAYILMKVVIRAYPSIKKEIEDIFFNTLAIFFLVYKFSIIIKDPSMLLHNPYGLLYFTGGTTGVILACITVSIYMIKTVNKKHLPIIDAALILMTTYISGFAAYLIQHYFLFR